MSRPIIIAVAALLSASATAWNYSAAARGGHGGFHSGLGVPVASRPSAFIFIDVSATNDAQMFKAMVTNAVTNLTPFGGHILIDVDNPTSWDGAAPQHLLVIAFASLEKAQAWKDSESFKAFDVDRQRAATSRVFVVEGTADTVPASGLRGRFMRFDPKPFEEIIKKRDQDLNRIKDICKGC